MTFCREVRVDYSSLLIVFLFLTTGFCSRKISKKINFIQDYDGFKTDMKRRPPEGSSSTLRNNRFSTGSSTDNRHVDSSVAAKKGCQFSNKTFPCLQHKIHIFSSVLTGGHKTNQSQKSGIKNRNVSLPAQLHSNNFSFSSHDVLYL